MKRDDIYYEAMKARDPRFDGKFFVGVKTTGIYCRPICPAKPKRQNVEFFSSTLEAERAGYRPCLRCRPESAPHSAAWMGKSAVVQRAVKLLQRQQSLDFDEDSFAGLFGVSARHLRRLFKDEIGKTPKQLAFENRLNLARKLITETALPLTEIAFASGFQSIRRFNSAFKQRFKRNPSQLRRRPLKVAGALQVYLPYRPPFHFEALLESYRNHQIGDLEDFEAHAMYRLIHFDGVTGEVKISNEPDRCRLRLEIDFADNTKLQIIIARVRELFDLDSDPILIAKALEFDAKVAKILRRHPGIRVPSGWDSFEISIATILGQLVSVAQGRRLVTDLIELLGEDSGYEFRGKRPKLFPTPEAIASGDLTSLRTKRSRKRTLQAFATAVSQGDLSLESTQDVDLFRKKAMSLPGIGAWTAEYITLKVLRHADAFPGTDLILKRAVDLHGKDVLERMRPWRSYVASLFWREYAGTLKKKVAVS